MEDSVVTCQDHLGRIVHLPSFPQRIVSLCPSITKTLVDLGLGHRLVGRTRFCIHPKEIMQLIPQVGGTKEINFDRLRALDPDLIIGEKEENTQEMIASLEAEYPVYMTDVVDFATAQEMVIDLGRITRTEAAAGRLLQQLADSWAGIQTLAEPIPCLYLIWKNPWMAAGANTFIDSVLEKCGFNNLATNLPGRYPVLDDLSFFKEKPILIFLSTEPYPFKNLHIAEIQGVVPEAKVRLVDGEMFSWYGSHLVGVENYLNLLLKDSRD
jgi:iron complex transport system substrate-binding protein